MPPDLVHLLNEAAPEPDDELDPDQLWASGRERRRRRHLSVGAAAIVAVAVVATVSLAWLDDPEPDATVVTGDLVTHEDVAQGVTVSHPVSWRRATTRLTPHLGGQGGLAEGNVFEILSLGTADLPVGGDACAQYPVAALEAMSPTDAFVTVQERLIAEDSAPTDEELGEDFPPRPEQFPPGRSKNGGTVVECLAQPPEFDHWSFSFQDAGRTFYVLAAIGTHASEQTRAETWAILDSLQFDDTFSVARVPSLEGLTLEQAGPLLQDAGLHGGPNDGDPTDARAVVVAHEPPAGEVVSRGAIVGFRTALVTPEICDALHQLPDFSDGARWDLPVDRLRAIADIAGPALRADTWLVINHITNDDPETPTASRALDRLAIHRRACD